MPSDLTLESVVKSKPRAFSTQVGSDLVIFDPERGQYYGSGVVGHHIWTLIEKPKRISEVCNLLLDEFEVEQKTCEEEVLNFLSDLQTAELVQIT